MIIGIDNGLDGGIVVMHDDGRVYRTIVMPVIGKKGKGKRQYNIPEMVASLTNILNIHVFIERAQAMPAQGVTSTFSIGYGFGLWQGICTALEISFTVVRPQAWQKVMFEGMSKQDTKQASALVAGRLAPDTDWRASERCRKPHDGLTDAFCIAEYGRRILRGNELCQQKK